MRFNVVINASKRENGNENENEAKRADDDDDENLLSAVMEERSSHCNGEPKTISRISGQVNVDLEGPSSVLILFGLVSRDYCQLPALVVFAQGAHHISLRPLMHLAEEPVVLVVIAPANKQVHSEMLDPFPVSFIERLEEVVQAEIVAEDEGSLSFDLFDDGLHFGMDLSADSEDAVVAVLVCRTVAAAGSQAMRLALLVIESTFTWVYIRRLNEIRPYLVPDLWWKSLKSEGFHFCWAVRESTQSNQIALTCFLDRRDWWLPQSSAVE